MCLLHVPLAGLQECGLLTKFVPTVWHRISISRPWLCDQLIHLSLKNYCEIPHCVQGRHGCLHWWKWRQPCKKQENWVNTSIPKQAPEEEAGADEGEKDRRGFFSLLNSSHSQTLEALCGLSDDSTHMLLVACSRGIKDWRSVSALQQCWGKTSSSAAYKHWCLVSGLIFLGQAPWSALISRMISNRS